jgi:DNA polymerase III alpha subunit
MGNNDKRNDGEDGPTLLDLQDRAKKKTMEEFSSRELLNFEKEMLGLYISGHPLAEYQDILSGFVSIQSLYDEKDKTTQTIAGVISQIKQILTKSNQPMYFLTLEDLTESIEVIIFPTVLEKHRAILETDRIIKVRGKLDRKEDQVKLIAIEVGDIKSGITEGRMQEQNISTIPNKIVLSDDIEAGFKDNEFNDDESSNDYNHYMAADEGKDFPPSEEKGMSVSEAAQENGSLVIIINKQQLSRDVINELYGIIRANPGGVPVELKIANGNDTGIDNGIEKAYKLAGDFKVKCDSPLFAQLKEKFKDSIKWDRHPDIR